MANQNRTPRTPTPTPPVVDVEAEAARQAAAQKEADEKAAVIAADAEAAEAAAASKAAEKPKASKASAALKAVHRITYGNNITVEPGSIFTPTSAAEREELLAGDLPAAVELDELEAKLFASGEIVEGDQSPVDEDETDFG